MYLDYIFSRKFYKFVRLNKIWEIIKQRQGLHQINHVHGCMKIHGTDRIAPKMTPSVIELPDLLDFNQNNMSPHK